jgi:hypothetical protein
MWRVMAAWADYCAGNETMPRWSAASVGALYSVGSDLGKVGSLANPRQSYVPKCSVDRLKGCPEQGRDCAYSRIDAFIGFCGRCPVRNFDHEPA